MEGVNILRDLYCKAVLKAVWPICVGYLPLGFACGVLAQKVGVSVWETAMMSVLVFAGSGQFIALAMIGGGASIASIVLTTFIVNLRHTLYSSTLSTYVMGQSKRYLSFFSQGIVDETFAVNLSAFNTGEWNANRALALNVLAHGCWVFSTMLGNLAGNVLPIDMAVISYTLTAMFIGLWTFHFDYKLKIIIGLFSGLLAVGLSGFLTYKLHIVVATVIAATFGCMIEGGRQHDKS